LTTNKEEQIILKKNNELIPNYNKSLSPEQKVNQNKKINKNKATTGLGKIDLSQSNQWSSNKRYLFYLKHPYHTQSTM